MKTLELTLIMVVIISFFGCDGKPSSKPRVARRHFSGTLRIGSVATEQREFQYENSRPDGGYAGRPQFALWARPFYSDESPCDIGGVEINAQVEENVENGIHYPLDQISIDNPFYTNDTGYGIFYVGIDSSGFDPKYSRGWQVSAHIPRASNYISGWFGRKGPANYYEWLPIGSPYPIVQGEYWASGSSTRFGHLAMHEVGERYIRPAMASIPVPDNELAFLNSDPNIPGNLFAYMRSENWYRAKRDGDNYIAKSADELYPLKTRKEDVILNKSTPYFVDWCFVSSEPVFIKNNVFTASVKVDGIYCDPNYLINGIYSDIYATVIEESKDGLKHIARSEYIVPIDPNGFAPYRLTSSHGVNFLVLPLKEGAEINFAITDYQQFLPFVANKWLTDCPQMDIKLDGIVNYLDFALFKRKE